MKNIYTIILLLIFSVSLCNGQLPVETKSVNSFPFRQSRLIPDITDLYGVSWYDLNGDEKPDLYLTAFRGLNRVLLNRNKKNFSDATIISGLGGNLMPRGIVNLELGNAVFDWDNDGDGDVLICGWGESTKFYQNRGNLKFIDITEKLNLIPPYDFNDAVVADVDNDGYLDLFFTDEHYANQLLLNIGGREFRDVSESSGIKLEAISQTASFADVDLDGDVDLYVANWLARDWFFENDGKGHFSLREITIPCCIDSSSSNSASFADVDNDGDYDLFVAVKNGKNILAINQLTETQKPWIFKTASQSELSKVSANSYGGNFADADQDGDMDIFVCNRGANRYYQNNGAGQFSLAYEDSLLPHSPAYSTGSAFCDFDDDGDLDLFVANKDTLSLLLENLTVNGHYIKFDLHGVSSNRDAIGTRVTLYTQNGENPFAYREVGGGSAYLSQNDFIVHFGVPENGEYKAKIRYPSAREINLDNLHPGNTYTVYEMNFFERSVLRIAQTTWREVRNPVFWWILINIIIFISLSLTVIRMGVRKYNWKPGSTAFLVTLYFVVAMLISIVLRFSEMMTILFALNGFSLIFIILMAFFSKGANRLRKQREDYREKLIEAGSKILDSTKREDIIKLFSQNVTRTPEINKCDFIPFDPEKKDFIFPDWLDEGGFTAIIASKNNSNLPDKTFIPFSDNGKSYSGIACKRGEIFYGIFLLSVNDPSIIKDEETADLLFNLSQQSAVSFQNIENIRQAREYIARLTEAEVREEYLGRLEKQNNILSDKNRELTDLFNQLKSTQSQLVLSEKMASLGRLVAGIAHELNNPISFIYANVNQMEKDIKKVKQSLSSKKGKEKNISKVFKEIEEMIQETRLGSVAVKELVENLRRFSHLDKSDWQMADIHKGIETCLMILQPEIKNRIAIERNFGTIPKIECHPGQLNQVFLNILSNAAQAIKEQGKISIRSESKGQMVIITINDDGNGIAPESLDKIFDPFFSSKDVGEGSGLGLSISQTIINNHQGRIEVESKIDEGSTFRVYLPVHQSSKKE